MVVYSGSAADRETIRATEFLHTGDRQHSQRRKFHVLLTSYEMVLKDAPHFTRNKCAPEQQGGLECCLRLAQNVALA